MAGVHVYLVCDMSNRINETLNVFDRARETSRTPKSKANTEQKIECCESECCNCECCTCCDIISRTWKWMIVYTFPIVVILLYYLDICTDIQLAVSYLQNQHYFWGGLTAIFIIVPWLLCFTIYYKSVINGGEGGVNVETRWGQLLCSAIAPVYAQMKIYITRKGEEEEEDDPGFDNYNMEEESKLDGTLLSILESFTEAAPQLLLQMYISIKAIDDPKLDQGYLRYLSMGVGLFTISFSLSRRESARINWLRSKAVQTELTRKYRENKGEMLQLKKDGKKRYNEFPFKGLVFHFVMRILEIAQRIIALGLIASTPQFFPYVMSAIAMHWAFPCFWEVGVICFNNWQQRKTDNWKTKAGEKGHAAEQEKLNLRTKVEEEQENDRMKVKNKTEKSMDVGFASEGDDEDEQARWITIVLLVVKASMLLFCHENQTKHRNTLKMVLFYTIFYVENTVAVSLWLQYTPLSNMWFYTPVFCFFVVAPILHVTLHIIIDIFFMKQKDVIDESIDELEGNESPATNKSPSCRGEEEQTGRPLESKSLL